MAGKADGIKPGPEEEMQPAADEIERLATTSFSDVKPVPALTISSDPFVLMDRLDDAAIMSELEGVVVETLVYHYEDDDGEVWGLAKAGVDEACSRLANQGYVVREEQLQYEVQDRRREAYFRVQATRYAVFSDGREIRLESAWGAKRQPIMSRGAYNPHWFEQGSMKAARNARARLIGSELKARIIELAKQTGKVQKIEAIDDEVGVQDSESEKPSLATRRQLDHVKRLLKNSEVSESMRARIQARLAAQDLTADEASRIINFLLNRGKTAGPGVGKGSSTKT